MAFVQLSFALHSENSDTAKEQVESLVLPLTNIRNQYSFISGLFGSFL